MSTESPSRSTPQNGRRSNSLVGGFIKRSRSSDLLGSREPQSPNGSRIQSPPPSLPSFEPQPQMPTFGGENYTSKMEPSQAAAAPAIAQPNVHGRTESMTNRGRYSYATSLTSSVNSPRRVRRRKDPTPYNVLVIGARNSGKTSFLNFLKSSIAPHPDQQNARNPELDYPPPSARTNPGTFVQHYQEVEVENERIGLSIWDSQGFEKNLIDYQLRGLSDFVESKFEDTFIEEMKVVRSPGYKDTHIHCVFFLFDPAQLDLNINIARNASTENIGSIRRTARVVGALDEDFELQILKNLQGKSTVIPVISKADTVTTAHMEFLKKMVGESFQQAGLDPLEALHFEGYDSDGDALDEVEEDEEETAKNDKVPPPAEPEKETASTDAETESDATSASGKAEEGEIATAVEVQMNTKKPLIPKRDTSLQSVSSAMFDNGYMPMSILSPDEHSLKGGDGRVGRQFVWGFADPHNPQHCDFVKLKETCFTEWRAEFRDASREVFYERWRTGRLNRGPVNGLKKNSNKSMARKASGGIPIELTPRGKKYT